MHLDINMQEKHQDQLSMGTGKQPGKPKRKYVGAEIRAARVKELTESISSLKETIELLCKQKQQYSNAEKFLQEADVNSSILEKNRERRAWKRVESTQQIRIKVKEKVLKS